MVAGLVSAIKALTNLVISKPVVISLVDGLQPCPIGASGLMRQTGLLFASEALSCQQALDGVFQKFRELGSSRQTTLWYRDERIPQ